MVARIISRSTDAAETPAYITRGGAIESVVRNGELSSRTAYHLVLSWEGDVTDAHAIATATQALTHLGLDTHPSLFTVHRDTEHPHIHVVVDLVGDTGKRWNTWHDRAKLYRFVLQYNGAPLHANDIVRGRDRQFEFWTGNMSFTRYAHQRLQNALQSDDVDWEQAHRALAQDGIAIHTTPRGIVFVERAGTHAVRGSKIAATLPTLEKRLGPWRPAPEHLPPATTTYSNLLKDGVLLAPWVEHDPDALRLYETFRSTSAGRKLTYEEQVDHLRELYRRRKHDRSMDMASAQAALADVRMQPAARAGIRDAMLFIARDENQRDTHERAGRRKAATRHLTHFRRWLRRRAAQGDMSGRLALWRTKPFGEEEVRDLTGLREGILMEFSAAVEHEIQTPPTAVAPEHEAACKIAFCRLKNHLNAPGIQAGPALDAAMAACEQRHVCQPAPSHLLRIALALAHEYGLDEKQLDQARSALHEPNTHAGLLSAGQQTINATQHDALLRAPAQHEVEPPAPEDAPPAQHDAPPKRGARAWFVTPPSEIPDELSPSASAYLATALSGIPQPITRAVDTLTQRQEHRERVLLAQDENDNRTDQERDGDRFIAKARCTYLNRVERDALNRYILASAAPLTLGSGPEARAARQAIERRFAQTEEQRLAELPRLLLRHHTNHYSWDRRQAGFEVIDKENIHILNTQERESSICALLMAYETFGNTQGITIDGSDEFKKTMVEAAVRLGIEDSILNKECQPMIKAARAKQAKEHAEEPEFRYEPLSLDTAVANAVGKDVSPSRDEQVSGVIADIVSPTETTAYAVLGQGNTRVLVPVLPEHVNELRAGWHVTLVRDGATYMQRERAHAQDKGMER